MSSVTLLQGSRGDKAAVAVSSIISICFSPTKVATISSDEAVLNNLNESASFVTVSVQRRSLSFGVNRKDARPAKMGVRK